MSKKKKDEVAHGEDAVVERADTASAPSAPADAADAQPEVKRAFTSSQVHDLSALNASAYHAHKSDAELKKKAAEAAVKAAQAVLGKIPV